MTQPPTPSSLFHEPGSPPTSAAEPAFGRIDPVPGVPAAQALDDFRRARDELSAIGMRLLGVNPQAATPLCDWLLDIQQDEQRIAARLRGQLARRDMPGLMHQAVELSDIAIEGELAAKVIGKSVSAIDQLTRLA